MEIISNDSTYNYFYTEEILKSNIYKPIFKLYALHPDETIDYEILQENIVANTGSYTENYQNGQRRNLNINLINNDGQYLPKIDNLWVHNKFKLEVGISLNGEEHLFPRGIYVLNNPNAAHQLSNKQISLSLSDKFALLEGKPGTLETTYVIPVGSDIEEALNEILSLDNGSGYPLDTKPIIYDPSFSGMEMPYTLSKDAGSTLGELILDIGTILNAEIYYNSEGNLCIMPINVTTLDIQKPIVHHYRDTEKDYFGATMTYDFENAVNTIYVVGDNINNEIFSAKAENNMETSPLCIARIGRRVSYINDSNIYSDDLAQQRADYELRSKTILDTIMNMEVSFNPLFFVNNIISITDSYYELNDDKFVIQSISYNLGSQSKMTLSCSNIKNYNSFYPEVFITSTEWNGPSIIEWDVESIYDWEED